MAMSTVDRRRRPAAPAHAPAALTGGMQAVRQAAAPGLHASASAAGDAAVQDRWLWFKYSLASTLQSPRKSSDVRPIAPVGLPDCR